MEYEADIMVNVAVIIELKSVRRIIKAHACPVKFLPRSTPLFLLFNWGMSMTAKPARHRLRLQARRAGVFHWGNLRIDFHLFFYLSAFVYPVELLRRSTRRDSTGAPLFTQLNFFALI